MTEKHMPGSDSNPTFSPELEAHLRRLASTMPATVKFRVLNALEHFERAFRLLEIDREMASFRAITGEEEAASALINAIQLRRYPHAKAINSRDHQHKAAVIACMIAVARDVIPILKQFQLVFNFDKRRVDLKVPLSNFDIPGAESFAVQPVEPLDLVRGTDGADGGDPFTAALRDLAIESNYENVRRMVSAQANGRNTLLYASDSDLPKSRVSYGAIVNRKMKALTLLVVSAMVLQSRKHQSLVCQAIDAFLRVISRLPPAGTANE